MKKPVIEIEEGNFLVKLRKQFYEREPIFAAAYKFTDLCSILIEPIDDYSVGVYFKPFKDSNIDLNKIAETFCNEVLDQQVRLDLEKRYGNIRDLIVKQAFAPIQNLKEKIDING